MDTDTVLIREVSARPARLNEFAPTGVVTSERVFRLWRSQRDAVITGLERAMADEDPAIAERAALDLAQIGSGRVRSGVLGDYLSRSELRKSLIAEDGQAVRAVAEVQNDFGAYMDLHKSESIAQQTAVERLELHDRHCPGGATCEIEGTGRWARA